MSFAPESRYLKASDLPEDRDSVVTITGMVQEEVGNDKQKKWVISLKEFDKGVVLNVTRTKALMAATGTDDEEEVVGKKVSLYVGEEAYKGENYAVIAIRNKPPKALAGKPKSAPAEESFPD